MDAARCTIHEALKDPLAEYASWSASWFSRCPPRDKVNERGCRGEERTAARGRAENGVLKERDSRCSSSPRRERG